jgi:hypothetical protein
MRSGVWIRLLGAAIIYLALASIVLSLFSFGNLPYYRATQPTIWGGVILGIILDLALAWAGAAIVSRRPSRRRAVAVILAVSFAVMLYDISSWLRPGMSVYWPPIVYLQLFRLVLLATGLTYVVLTWRRPEFQPQLAIAPTPPGSQPHHTVAAKIVDGPNWHADLIASLQQTGMQATPRRRVWPWILALFAATLFAALVSNLSGMVLDGVDPQWRPLFWLIIGFVYLGMIGTPLANLRRRTSQARQRSAEDALRKSGAKRPIFYLRSFGLDEQIGRTSLLEIMSNIQPANPEQAMIRVARRCGPVLAIGRPGERLPALGAARFYVSDELWQEKVADVATVAQLVVWASGTTQGLEWEITHLVRSLSPEKLILWPHPQLLSLDSNEREAQWAAFAGGLGTLFPHPLPKPLGQTQFFAFDKDFTPIPFAAHRLTAQGRLTAALRALLRAKNIPPYDKAHVARQRRMRRMIFGTLGAIAALIILGIGYLFVDYVRPRAPEPLAWNLLGSDLFADEAYVSPPSASEIISNLQNTIGQLDGRWFGSNWESQKPGEFPPLKHAAENYLQPYVLAHGDTRIDQVFYGIGNYLEFQVGSAADAQALLQKLGPLRNALDVAERDWQNAKSDTAGYFYADKMRALLAARKSIFNAETDLLTLMATHPNAWTATRGADGTAGLRFSQDTLPQAQSLVAQRQAGMSALTAALKP